MTYAVDVLDPEAGFWTGRAILTGPRAGHVSRLRSPVDTGDFFQSCGGTEVFSPTDVACAVKLTLPAGSPIGAWSVSAVELTDNAGNSVRVADLNTDRIRLTRNEAADGTLHLGTNLRGLPPGTHTAGFTLFDAANLHSHYGYPNGVGQPAPSGPLVLTVTDG